MEKINCSYVRCPAKNQTIKDFFVCKTCRERIYCSESCMNKDWNEIHSEICLSFSRGASVLKFQFEEFEDLYSSQAKNFLKSYGGLGTSKLVKHKQSMKPFVLKTVKIEKNGNLFIFFRFPKKSRRI